MNTSELVEQVADRADLSPREAAGAVEATLAALESELAAGREVAITGFGRFSIAERAAGQARNPRTGGPIDIPAGRALLARQPAQARRHHRIDRARTKAPRTQANASPRRPAARLVAVATSTRSSPATGSCRWSPVARTGRLQHAALGDRVGQHSQPATPPRLTWGRRHRVRHHRVQSPERGQLCEHAAHAGRATRHASRKLRQAAG